MLIVLYLFIIKVAVPQIGAYAQVLFEPTMLILIISAGILMLFASVGMKISNNLAATVADGIFKGIGYLFRTLFQAIGWIVSKTFKMIPHVFNESKKTFNHMGLNTVNSNILAVVAVVAFVAIIIWISLWHRSTELELGEQNHTAIEFNQSKEFPSIYFGGFSFLFFIYCNLLEILERE